MCRTQHRIRKKTFKLTWTKSKESCRKGLIKLKAVKDDHVSDREIAFNRFTLFTFRSDVQVDVLVPGIGLIKNIYFTRLA